MADQMLQVALNKEEKILSDSLFWLGPVPNGDEIIVYNGIEYKKSDLCNATLRWLELSEQEKMFSSYCRWGNTVWRKRLWISEKEEILIHPFTLHIL